MESRLIILLVFASFAQGSYVQKLAVTYGLEKEQINALNTILLNEYNTEATQNRGVNALFNFFYSPDPYSNKSVAVTGTSITVASPYDSVPIALGSKTCDKISNARKKSASHFAKGISKVTAAFALAVPGSYEKVKNEIASYREEIQKQFVTSAEVFFTAISNCLKPKEEDVKAIIAEAQEQTIKGLDYLNQALLNAANLRASSNTICGNAEYLIRIKELHTKALAGLRTDRETRHSLLRSLYLYKAINKPGIAKELYVNQRAFAISYRGYRVANEVLFSTIRRHLNKIEFGFKSDGSIDFSLDEADLQAVINHFDTGDFAISDSFLAYYPNNSEAILAGRKIIHGLNVAGDEDFYIAIAAATAEGANYVEIVKQIEARRASSVGLAPDYDEVQFGLIRNGQTFTAEVEAELVKLEELFDTTGRDSASLFIDAVIVLANATNTRDIYDGIYDKVDDIMYQAFEAVDHIVQSLSAATLTVLKTRD